ncbi:hypothetical protein EY643_17870 [Halioglobus maricola]|uniref:DUF4239 domain-containing protein n=1 Tax=Halioglobus maricola TaxID=2601894 RepID=A0A5P9NNK3_9GAMM|nr:hypothetical protein [Halioglobus maricola]QFU77381.1 hypothetical protein EY643_17870 [Halioglobus maricola]
MREILDTLPLLAILPITLVVVLIAIEIGFHAGRWRVRSLGGKSESEAQLSAMTGAHLALLAFIMAFSFNMAAGHYQDRRALIMKDANAISTAYLRTSLVDSAESRNISELLVQYVDVRLTFKDAKTAGPGLAKTQELQELIWSEVQQLVSNHTPTVLHSLLIQSLNEVFDVHDERAAAGLKHRVPSSLWIILAALLVLSMTGIGYFSGHKGVRNPIASTGLALSFSMVLFLIADLDRPTGGLLKADQSAIFELRQQLN